MVGTSIQISILRTLRNIFLSNEPINPVGGHGHSSDLNIIFFRHLELTAEIVTAWIICEASYHTNIEYIFSRHPNHMWYRRVHAIASDHNLIDAPDIIWKRWTEGLKTLACTRIDRAVYLSVQAGSILKLKNCRRSYGIQLNRNYVAPKTYSVVWQIISQDINQISPFYTSKLIFPVMISQCKKKKNATLLWTYVGQRARGRTNLNSIFFGCRSLE